MMPAADTLYKKLNKKLMVVIAVIICCMGLQAVILPKNPTACNSCSIHDGDKGLKDYYKNYFPIGVAVNMAAIKGPEAELIVREFNS